MLGLSAASLVNSSLRSSTAFTELRDGLCRESRYGSIGGINASCTHPRATFNVSYRWKTFQNDVFDAEDRARVLAAAGHGGPVVLVLEGGGPHHFAKFREHHRVRRPDTLFTTVDDSWNWPQFWIDDYINSTKRLMRLHGGLPANVCVLWKTMNIAPRSNQTGSHHPSVVNGVHHWLNRIAISIAQDLGIGVVDLSDLTISMRATPKLSGAHATRTSEGDPYHGFSLQLLTPELLRRTCAACSTAFSGKLGSVRGRHVAKVPLQCVRNRSTHRE